MLDKTKDKHLNALIKELELEVARTEIILKRDEVSKSLDVRERAVARAVFKTTQQLYLRVRKGLSIIITLTRANEQPDLFNGMTEEEYVNEATKNLAEIRELIRASNQFSVNREAKTQLDHTSIARDAELLTLYRNRFPYTVKVALDTLARFGLLSLSINWNAVQFNPPLPVLPRGNPAKGGMVRKFLSQGYNLAMANQLAEEELNKGMTTTFARAPLVSDEPTITVEKGLEMLDKIKRPKDEIEEGQRLLKMLDGNISDDAFVEPEDLVDIPSVFDTIPESPKPLVKSQDEIIAAIKKAQKSPQLFKSTVFSRMSAQIARDAKKE